MKINDKILSLPPHISTSWDNVSTLQMSGTTLVIHLKDGKNIRIPDLKPEVLETIFDAHAIFLEKSEKLEKQKTPGVNVFPFQQLQGESGEIEFPFRFGPGAMEGWNASLQHNQAQAAAPDLPEEVLEKIRSIAKIIAPDDPMVMPKPEPHCNCMHCQIARAIHQGLGITDIYTKNEENVEEITEDDLHFQQWEIKQTDDKLYSVVNRLDAEEKYNVFLGHPVGCTCGKEGCEHILAVLKS